MRGRTRVVGGGTGVGIVIFLTYIFLGGMFAWWAQRAHPQNHPSIHFLEWMVFIVIWPLGLVWLLIQIMKKVKGGS